MDSKKLESIFPLAPQQQGVFLESRASTATGLHIEQEIHSLCGPLDVDALCSAWQSVVDRHAMLRTAFVWKGQEQPLQAVLRYVRTTVDVHDVRRLDREQQRLNLEEFLAADRRQGFELNRPPLARLTLFRTGDETFDLVRTYHHILIDGWSVPILTHDLMRFYANVRNGETILVEPASSYRDYVAWLKRQDNGRAEEYWRYVMSGVRQCTPIGRPSVVAARLDVPQTYRTVESRLSALDTAALRTLARVHGLTLNTVLQGAWALLLSRYSGERDIVFGTTVSGRSADIPNADSTVGLFVNTLPFRLLVQPEMPLAAWLETVQTRHLRLRQFEHCSTGQIHQWTDMPPTLPLFESAVVYENYPESPAVPGAAELNLEDIRKARSIGAQTKFAVTLLIIVDDDVPLRMVYDPRRFNEGGADQIVDHFSRLLSRIATMPDCDLQALLADWPNLQVPRFRALPRRDVSADTDFASAPRNSVESALAGIWSEVLGLDRVGIFDDLLQLGAHSLIATQAVARIRSVMRVDLPLAAIFNSPTISELSDVISLLQSSGGRSEVSALTPVERDRSLPLSFAQQRLWLLEQLDPGLAIYNSPCSIAIAGRLDADALARSLSEIISRHEVLRTVFGREGEEPVQIVMAPRPFALASIDVSTLSADAKTREIERLMRDEVDTPFNLSLDLMVRGKLVHLGSDEHRLLLTVHHIASDRWSFAILMKELAAFYAAFSRGNPSPLPNLEIQYADYAVWEREKLSGSLYADQLHYWQRRLADVSSEPLLITDRPRAENSVYTGESYISTVSIGTRRALQAMAGEAGCTLYMVLLAAMHVLLHYRSGRNEIVTGSNVANRENLEIEALIGFFVNQIVLTSDVSGDPTFRAFLGTVREVVLQGYAHQQVPFDLVLADQKRERSLNLTPLFQVLFVQNTPIDPIELQGITIMAPEFDASTSKFDLAVFAQETGDGLQFTWIYKTDLFFASTITAIADQLGSLLTAVAADPGLVVSALIAVLTQRDKEKQVLEKSNRERTSRLKFQSVRPRAVQAE